MESSDVTVAQAGSPVTLKKQSPWGWEKHWIIHPAPNHCSALFFFFEWVSVCFYWDAVMSWIGAPVCKWKRCSSVSLPSFTQAHLGFMFCRAGREKIPPWFFYGEALCVNTEQITPFKTDDSLCFVSAWLYEWQCLVCECETYFEPSWLWWCSDTKSTSVFLFIQRDVDADPHLRISTNILELSLLSSRCAVCEFFIIEQRHF